MSAALEQAYASNTETPLLTVELSHSALTGGVLRFVRGYYDITATTEAAATVVFTATGMGLNLPQKSSDGDQQLDIQLDNVSNEVFRELEAVRVANRTTEEPINCILRPYLESDLSAPAGATYELQVKSVKVTRNAAVISATYSPLPNVSYPRKRYYPTTYVGLRYV